MSEGLPNHKPRVALVATNAISSTETFVQRHRELMQAEVISYHGGYPSKFNNLEGRFASRQPGYYLDKLAQKAGLDRNPEENALKRSFLKNGIEICFAEFGPNGVGAMSVCADLGIPLIVNFHGYDIHKHEVLKDYRERYIQLFQIAKIVIGVSREMCSKLAQLGCPQDKIRYLPCAPDDRFFELRPARNNQRILSIGRFVDKKAPYITLLAFQQLQRSFPDSELMMIGSGPLLTCCKNIAQSLGLGNVRFTGAIAHEEALAYFEDSSVFVQHSVTDENGNKEGTPVSVMEASAAGLPVVSTRHAGIPDVVLEGETGLLVDELDIDGMARNLATLLNNPEKGIELGNRGREFIASILGPDIYKKQLNDILDECVIISRAPG